ncbi:MAG: hypothetical protein J0J01_27830 [Reyranella sp.]|uniref:hypothetical protein n=1 Tax=Reyranella sp. TaxID=1929291 RepID=UPI001AD34B8F|nr:hypothetical protein [Reyranella sp.]MBN9090740.1 hypothetical protein [Reyranella sp.]
MKATVLAFGLSSLALGACVHQTAQQPRQMPGPAMSIAEAKAAAVESRKDEMMRELATCESGGHGESDRPIYGFRGMFVGRFQFMPTTVRAMVQQRDGMVLSLREATDLAHDYERAKDLAKYMIFEQGQVSAWPACARKLGLYQQVSEIQSAQAQ